MLMSGDFDLDAYRARIGDTGPRTPTLATLERIHAHHATTLAFENIDPLLGNAPALDIESLQAKLVRQRRGGYCFEQNTLLAAALAALGFTITPLAARVRWMVPPDRPEGSRSHMLLRIDLRDEGSFLADVGSGGMLMGAPLRFVRDIEQRTPYGTFRLTGTDQVLTLQARLPNGWQDMYRFTLEPQLPIDYVVANWYTATHPRSMFRGNLVVQRLTPAARHTLFNTRLTTRDHAGNATDRTLATARELDEILETVFDITLPVPVDVIWEKLPKS